MRVWASIVRVRRSNDPASLRTILHSKLLLRDDAKHYQEKQVSNAIREATK
jgi:hypothetical protein